MMKKIAAAILVICIFVLAGCGATKTDSSQINSNETSEQTTPGQTTQVQEAVEFTIEDFNVYVDGETVEKIEDNELAFISFAHDYKGVKAATRRGIALGWMRFEVVTIYNAERVGSDNIQDKGDRYFISFANEGRNYTLRFFFDGSDDDSVVTEIDIMDITDL